MKRGMSQTVANILLVGLVIALLVLVFLWGKHYMQEKAAKEGKLSESKLKCQNIDFRVNNAYQKASEAYITIENKGNFRVSRFTFRLYREDIGPKESLEKLGEFEIRQYVIPFAEDELKKLDKIEVIPWVQVIRGYSIPCSEKKIVYRVNRKF